MDGEKTGESEHGIGVNDETTPSGDGSVEFLSADIDDNRKKTKDETPPHGSRDGEMRKTTSGKPGRDGPKGKSTGTDAGKDIPFDVFFRRLVKNFGSLVLWAGGLYMGGRGLLWLHKEDLLPEIFGWRLFYFLQVINTGIVYYISRLFSIPVEWTPWTTTLDYPDPLYGISVIPDCTGISEMMFITGIIIGINLNMKWKVRLKWAGILCGVIFVENIVRLVCNWPIAKALGYEGWQTVHWNWWKYYQLGFVILLFLVWFLLVGRKYSPFLSTKADSGKKGERAKKKGDKGKQAKKKGDKGKQRKGDTD